MTELKATNHGEQEDGTGVQATGLDALLDGLFEPEPWVAEGACRGMTEVFFSDEPGDIEQAVLTEVGIGVRLNPSSDPDFSPAV